jgi:hypothetical protein
MGGHHSCLWCTPKSQISPKLGLSHSNCGISELGARSQLPALKGVKRACWKLRYRLGRGTSLLNYTVLHSNPTNKLVKTHYAPFWCWDKPRATLDSLDSPQPRLGRSHHLPPYSILWSSPLHLHPNGSFSRDSQSGVPKLSQFGLLGLWTLITPHPKLRSRRGLNQSCSSPQELSNGVSHFTFTHQNWVNSWLLVVGSQIVSLTLGLSFDHNLCYKCPNGSCEAILDIHTSRPFQRYKKHFNARCADPCNRALSFWESRRTPKSHFRECEWRPHTSLKMGLRQPTWLMFMHVKEVKALMISSLQRLVVKCQVPTWPIHPFVRSSVRPVIHPWRGGHNHVAIDFIV